jgi:hypothetical protein
VSIGGSPSTLCRSAQMKKCSDMTEADINAPVSWLCVDCGFNTAPGILTRAEIYQAFIAEGKEEVEQEINAQSEVYTVRDAV